MLILPIKKKWFDMILNHEKSEDYRDIKQYYNSRFCQPFNLLFEIDRNNELFPFEVRNPDTVKILFCNGYSKSSPTLIAECKLRIGTGKPEWGAEVGKEYYILEIIEITERNERL